FGKRVFGKNGRGTPAGRIAAAQLQLDSWRGIACAGDRQKKQREAGARKRKDVRRKKTMRKEHGRVSVKVGPCVADVQSCVQGAVGMTQHNLGFAIEVQ